MSVSQMLEDGRSGLELHVDHMEKTGNSIVL